jgi:hypothetical protein
MAAIISQSEKSYEPYPGQDLGMKVQKDSRQLEPFQTLREPQKTVWDIIAAWNATGVSRMTRSGEITVFSFKTQDPLLTEQTAANRTGYARVEENSSRNRNQTLRPIAKVTRAVEASLDEDRFWISEALEGEIREIYDDYFVARLRKKEDDSYQEEAEFQIEEIPAADRELIAKGAVFYWYLGVTEKPHGQQSNSSLIRFRRMPALDQSDIQAAKTRADFLRTVLPI